MKKLEIDMTSLIESENPDEDWQRRIQLPLAQEELEEVLATLDPLGFQVLAYRALDPQLDLASLSLGLGASRA